MQDQNSPLIPDKVLPADPGQQRVHPMTVVEYCIGRWEDGIFAGMERSKLKKSGVVTAMLLSSVLFASFGWLKPDNQGDRHFNEKVNLAFRRTAHLLLRAAGDSTARIPAVQNMGDGTFLLRLEHTFDYNLLPGLLRESFDLHGIQTNYDVSVLDCTLGDVLLGYNTREMQIDDGVTCGGRVQEGECYNLQISFAAPKAASNRAIGWWVLAGGFLLGGVSFAFWPWTAGKRNNSVVPTVASEDAVRLQFGASSLELANLTLLVGSVRHQLTYREAKLLHLFASHLHQLLERDFILQAVWKDEGILVGRSLDVFVSRLRKMLRDDPTVRITTVHGVGYRLEVKEAV